MGAVSLELWYAALGSPSGIIFTTNNIEKTKQRLYALRAETADPDLQDLIIKTSPTNPGGEIWIVKRKPHEA